MNDEGQVEPTVVRQHELEVNLDRPPLISWGAILGGLVCIISLSWLLYLLGLALGVSVADVSDGEAVGNGLGIGATIWMIISALVVFFIGSIMAARLSGKVDSTVGMLHGFVLWGIGTTLMLVLSFIGINTLLQTGASMVATTAGAMGSSVSAMSESAATAAANLSETQLAENIQARLKRRATTVLSETAAEQSDSVSQEEVRSAIESMDAETLSQISEDLIAGETTSAREALADATNLSQEEVNEIVEGVEDRFEEELGTEDNDTELPGDIAGYLQRQTSDLLADYDPEGGEEVAKDDLRDALSELSAEDFQAIALKLTQADTQGAKDYLVNNTSLNRKQINEIVDGVSQDVSRRVERYQAEISETVEMASSYAQAVLWTVFVASAMSLAVSILGGMMGAETSRTLYMEERASYQRPLEV